MMKKLSLLLASAMLLSFSGCHGSRGLDAFVLPEAFDTSRSHEITFWAKNDTNKTQTMIYEKAIADFEDKAQPKDRKGKKKKKSYYC